MMNKQDSADAVVKSIIVERDIEAAFRVWTEQIHLWWPAGHSRSGDPKTQVLMEGKVGGRFYERTSNGDEYEWGAVDVWEPPHFLAFRWYLGSSQELPTRVDVQFVPLSENRTRIELAHRGPELIGERWWAIMGIFHTAWDSVLSKFAMFLTST